MTSSGQNDVIKTKITFPFSLGDGVFFSEFGLDSVVDIGNSGNVFLSFSI